jgi:hypothetical protein
MSSRISSVDSIQKLMVQVVQKQAAMPSSTPILHSYQAMLVTWANEDPRTLNHRLEVSLDSTSLNRVEWVICVSQDWQLACATMPGADYHPIHPLPSLPQDSQLLTLVSGVFRLSCSLAKREWGIQSLRPNFPSLPELAAVQESIPSLGENRMRWEVST